MTPKKLTSPQKKALRELLDNHRGCVISSKWTSGNYSRVTRRTVPAYCQLLELRECERVLRDEPGTLARFLELRDQHPRARRFVACTNQLIAREALRRE